MIHVYFLVSVIVMKFLRISLVFSLFLSFSSVLHARGAGVCPIFDDGTVLLGKEKRVHGRGPQQGQQYLVWGDFGGNQDPNETDAQTAYREFIEETAHYTFGAGSPYNIQLNHVQQAEANGHFADHIHAVGQYRTYFVRIHGQKPDIQAIHKNAALAKRKLGKKAHVEKTDWQYFDTQTLKNAAFQNGNLPGANEPLFEPFKAVIRKASAQNFLATVVPLPAANPPAPAPAPAAGKHKRKTVRAHTKQRRVKQKVTRTRVKRSASKKNSARTHVKKQRPAKSKSVRSHARKRPVKFKSVRTPARQRGARHTGSRLRVKRTR